MQALQPLAVITSKLRCVKTASCAQNFEARLNSCSLSNGDHGLLFIVNGMSLSQATGRLLDSIFLAINACFDARQTAA